MNWLSTIEDFVKKRNQICALEVYEGGLGPSYHFVVLKRRRKKVQVIERGFVTSVKELPATIKKTKTPIVLVVNGKAVLHKFVDSSRIAATTSEELIKKHLPGIKQEDFYIQIYDQQQNSVICFGRKEKINPLIEIFQQTGYELADIYLGVATRCLCYDRQKNESINSGRSEVKIHKGDIVSLASSDSWNADDIYDTKRVDTDSNFIPLQAGVSYFRDEGKLWCGDSVITSLYKSHTDRNIVKCALLVAIGFVFLVMVTNMCFYLHYFEEGRRIESELSGLDNRKNEIEDVLNRYERNKVLIDEVNISRRSRIAEYSDKLAMVLPSEIKLAELNFFPMLERESSDSVYKCKDGEIEMKGYCSNSLVVNNWLSTIKSVLQAKDVYLKKFSFNSPSRSHNFEIRILK